MKVAGYVPSIIQALVGSGLCVVFYPSLATAESPTLGRFLFAVGAILATGGVMRIFADLSGSPRDWKTTDGLPLFVFALVLAIHAYFTVNPPPGRQIPLEQWFNINPWPLTWLLGSVLVSAAGLLSLSTRSIGKLLLGAVTSVWERIARRPNIPVVVGEDVSGTFTLRSVSTELFLGSFWVLYVLMTQAQWRPTDWNAWDGWPLVPLIMALMLLIWFIAWCEVARLDYGGKITLERLHRYWRLPFPALIGFILFVLTLEEFELYSLLWSVTFVSALTIGLAVPLVCLGPKVAIKMPTPPDRQVLRLQNQEAPRRETVQSPLPNIYTKHL